MKPFIRMITVMTLLLVVLSGTSAGEERKGTVSLGFQSQYGALLGTSGYARKFDFGPGYGARFRYYLGKKRAVGVSFDNQYHNTSLEGQTGDYVKRLQFNTTTFDLFKYFSRNKPASRYITAGAGIFTPTKLYSQGGPEKLRDGPVVMFGAGTEFFITRAIAIDITARTFALINDDGLSTAGHISLGFAYYVID